MTPIDQLVLVLDAGTTSTRAMAFDRFGTMAAAAQCDLAQHYPKPGWVEHDAAEIWESSLAMARAVVTQCGGPSRFACIGITNQRETIVAWDRTSGEPLHRALVWQDRRTADACAALREAGNEAIVQQATGLVLDPYFSATKMRWLLDNVSEVRAAAGAGRLCFGTVESWLAFRLTGGAHLTDAANASRTSLMRLCGMGWDDGLCSLFGVPASVLPEIVDNAGDFGASAPEYFGAPIPLTGMVGDQQSATIGQGCLTHGDTKATYGTGAFVLANMGERLPCSRHRLLGTVLCQMGQRRTYALEGSVFVAGSLVQWLRDGLGLIAASAETEAIARSVPDNGEVVIVPALSGLGAPHWRPDARAAITGMSFATTRAHIVRAALEAIAYQTRDLAEAFAGDGAAWRSLRIDGGMSVNDWIAQDLADILDLKVERPAFVETTALGAAMLAGVGAGLFLSLEEAAQTMRGEVQRFRPRMNKDERAVRLALWDKAIAGL